MKAGAIVIAEPAEVTRPLLSIVSGVTVVAELLYVPAVTPDAAKVRTADTAAEPSNVVDHVASPVAEMLRGVVKRAAVATLPATIEDTASITNAVLAICWVDVPDVAVGAVGVPVKAGLATGAASVMP